MHDGDGDGDGDDDDDDGEDGQHTFVNFCSLVHSSL